MNNWMKKEGEHKDDIESLKAFAKHEDDQLKHLQSIDEIKSEFKSINVTDDDNKLRDSFAGLALNALIIAHKGTYAEIYDESYSIADKLLKARKEVYGE
jgi:hypothetical protein